MFGTREIAEIKSLRESERESEGDRETGGKMKKKEKKFSLLTSVARVTRCLTPDRSDRCNAVYTAENIFNVIQRRERPKSLYIRKN